MVHKVTAKETKRSRSRDVLNRYLRVTVPSDYFRKDIRYFISVTRIRLGNHESTTLFFLFCFGLHPIFGAKIGRRKREDLFFGLHLMFGGKLDVGRREDLFFFLVSTRYLVETCLTVTFSDYF